MDFEPTLTSRGSAHRGIRTERNFRVNPLNSMIQASTPTEKYYFLTLGVKRDLQRAGVRGTIRPLPGEGDHPPTLQFDNNTEMRVAREYFVREKDFTEETL